MSNDLYWGVVMATWRWPNVVAYCPFCNEMFVYSLIPPMRHIHEPRFIILGEL